MSDESRSVPEWGSRPGSFLYFHLESFGAGDDVAGDRDGELGDFGAADSGEGGAGGGGIGRVGEDEGGGWGRVGELAGGGGAGDGEGGLSAP